VFVTQEPLLGYNPIHQLPQVSSKGGVLDMQALLFEMEPRDGHEDHYFRHATKLRPIVMQHEGLIFLERFKSLSRPKVILSHSLWRDEASIARWRTDREHQKSQVAGRFEHFKDYRIRISHTLRYQEPNKKAEEWSNDGSYSAPHRTTDRFVIILRSLHQLSTQEGETFASVTEPRSFLSVINAVNEADGQAKFLEALDNSSLLSVVLARVSRDYGMYDRDEAPQYFETVDKGE
jgi:heme-degrading monooxygenase HmoA